MNVFSVWSVVNVVSIASTMAGAASGVGAIDSTRCLNVQTPEPVVRTGSSTTVVLVIMSSLARLTRQPSEASTKSTLPDAGLKPFVSSKARNGIVYVPGSGSSDAVTFICTCVVSPPLTGGVNVNWGSIVMPGMKALTSKMNCEGAQVAVSLSVIAMSKVAGVPGSVGALVAGVPVTVGSCVTHVSAST